MGWERVWTLALVQFGAEDIEIRILIGLGVAFLVLMIVEGLRASFLLQPRKMPAATEMAEPRPDLPAGVSSQVLLPKKSGPQPGRARISLPRAIPKQSRPVSPHQPVRPMIRRGHSERRKPVSSEDAKLHP